jgi:antitoxin YefM
LTPVTTILVMNTASLATVKARLSEFVSSVHDTHERVVVTRNGVPAAVLIAPEDLEALEETLAILSDPQAMATLAEGEAAMDAGEWIDADQVREVLARRVADRDAR